MFRNILIAALTFMLFPFSALAADLTGTWQADDGGTYYLREMNGTLHWYGEERARNPRWANVFQGRIGRDRIKGTWMDVPKGRTKGHGELVLLIRDHGRVLVASRKTGGFGGSRWTRMGHRARAAAPQAVPQIAPQTAQRQAMRPQPQPGFSEDCVSFDPSQIVVQWVNGHWKIVEGDHWLFDFGNKRDEASSTFRIIRHYNLNQSCFVGRPNPSFTYMLSDGRAPAGSVRGEDCVTFDPNQIQVRQFNGRWKIVEGNQWLFDFAGNRAEAQQSAAIIRKYDFSRSCFVGRPNPSFSYMRR